MTSRDTLTAIEGSRLSQLFSGRWDKVLPKDRDGRIFLDLDPVQFRALLSWLVDIKRLPPGSTVQGPPLKTLPSEYQAGFLELCELLCSKEASNSTSGSCNQRGALLDEGDDNIMFDSQILRSEDQQRLKTWIQHESCPSKHCTGDLLFRATRDGFAPATFHQKCDGKGPTVVIAKSAGGHIFGGYTEAAWDSSSGWKHCHNSFLFRLSGPGGVGPSQHLIFQNLGNGIWCNSNYGPAFGGEQHFPGPVSELGTHLQPEWLHVSSRVCKCHLPCFITFFNMCLICFLHFLTVTCIRVIRVFPLLSRDFCCLRFPEPEGLEHSFPRSHSE